MKAKVTLTEDPELVAEIKESLKRTKGYCPCAIIQTVDTKCPCLEFRSMQEGECNCGLYVKTLQ